MAATGSSSAGRALHGSGRGQFVVGGIGGLCLVQWRSGSREGKPAWGPPMWKQNWYPCLSIPVQLAGPQADPSCLSVWTGFATGYGAMLPTHNPCPAPFSWVLSVPLSLQTPGAILVCNTGPRIAIRLFPGCCRMPAPHPTPPSALPSPAEPAHSFSLNPVRGSQSHRPPNPQPGLPLPTNGSHPPSTAGAVVVRPTGRAPDRF